MRAIAVHVAVFGVLVAAPMGCGSDAKKSDTSDASAKKAPNEQAGDEAKAAAPDAGEDDALHFDIKKDRSGVLARAASTLETTETIDADAPLRAHLSELSHGADKGPSNEALCRHMAEIIGSGAPEVDACARIIEHQRVKLGPEVFAEMAACVTQAKTRDALRRCEEAEKEAEKLLHENKHGDGLDQQTCEQLYVHFEKLAMADAGEHETLVREVLQEVRDDVLEACLDHGTRDEVECAMKAGDMKTLGQCQSSIL